ncbi:MAG: OmpA family protein [Desulfobacterales bacterium]|nr:OmpA family protein [Desulfobacterales bacterium]
MRKVLLPCISVIFLLTACAGTQTKTEKGAIYGAVIGAATGALGGQVIGKDTESTVGGAVGGAIAGAAAGAGIGKMMDNQEKELNEALAASESAAVRREGNLLAITLKGDLTFNTGSAKVKSGLHSEIDRIATVMKQYPDTSIRVEGHTDNVGTDPNNMALSRRRAESVKALFVQRGVSEFRIIVIPFGETKPVADNNSAEGRQKNRRVEIKIAPAQEGAS